MNWLDLSGFSKPFMNLYFDKNHRRGKKEKREKVEG